MNVFVAWNNGLIAETLEQCEQFQCYTLDDTRLSQIQLLSRPSDVECVPYLCRQHASILICHSLSPENLTALRQAGIAVFSGVSGNAELQAGILLMGLMQPSGTTSTTIRQCSDTACTGDCTACRKQNS